MYQLTNDPAFIERVGGARIPCDPTLAEYAEYLDWVAKGNTPLPYEAPDTFSPQSAARLQQFRDFRDKVLGRIAGIRQEADDNLEAGSIDQSTRDAIVQSGRAVRQGLKDAPQHQAVVDAIAARSMTALDAALLGRWAAIKSTVDPKAAAVYAKVDK